MECTKTNTKFWYTVSLTHAHAHTHTHEHEHVHSHTQTHPLLHTHLIKLPPYFTSSLSLFPTFELTGHQVESPADFHFSIILSIRIGCFETKDKAKSKLKRPILLRLTSQKRQLWDSGISLFERSMYTRTPKLDFFISICPPPPPTI